MKPKVTVIIPTYNRKQYVLRLLASLRGDPDIFEIIVVSQGKKEAYPVKNIYLPTPSMTHARNVGANAARGDLLLFLDDDCIAKPGLTAAHIKNFAEANVAASCGRVITPGQKEEPDALHVGRVGFLGHVRGGYSSNIPQEIDSVIGCNMCWRKNVWIQLGGADEKFTGNALREETDLSLRAKKQGYRILFVPDALVVHHRADTGGARKSEGRLDWYFYFFKNETYYFLKHRPAILLPLYLTTKLTWAVRCMFGFGREVSIRSLYTPFAGVLSGIHTYYG